MTTLADSTSVKKDKATVVRDEATAVSDCSTSTQTRPWTPGEVISLWTEHYETSRAHCKKTISDNEVVSCLKKLLSEKEVSSHERLNLLQHWVEIVLLHAYQSAFSPGAALHSYTEVLYVYLNDAFMPGDEQATSLVAEANLPQEKVLCFLTALKLWAKQSAKKGKALEALGWLICEPDRPGLVLCWDEAIPQARYLKHWDQSLEATVLFREAEDKLRLRIYPSDDAQDPYDVSYDIQGYEAEGLGPGSRVRFWKDLNKSPFIIAAVPLSPYAEQRKAEWSRVDEDAYTSDPMPVG